MFEGNLNIKPHVPKPEVCDDYNVLCNFPMNPNEAGYRYLQLVKSEWNSTFETTVGEITKGVTTLFDGSYEISLHNQKNRLETKMIEVIESNDCKTIFDKNLIDNNAGELESVDIVKENFKISDCEIATVSGYVHNGVKLFNRQHNWSSIRYFFDTKVTVGKAYLVIAYFKTEAVTNDKAHIVIKTDLDAYRQVGSSDIIHEADWYKIEAEFVLEQNDELFYLETHEYSGEVVIDHMLLIGKDEYDSKCRRNIYIG